MKNNKKTKRSAGGLFLIVGITAALIALVCLRAPKLAAPHVESRPTLDARTRLQATFKQYMQSLTHRDHWWLTEPAGPSPEQLRLHEMALGKVKDAVNSSRGACPLAQEIAAAFPSFLIAQYQNGGAVAVSAGGATPNLNGLELCFIAESDFRKGTFDSTLFYRSDWKAVMLGGVSWPEPFFSGVLMHELGHAYTDRKGGIPTMFTKPWFEEEVTMHELETRVLDYRTQGKYSKMLGEILEKRKDASPVSEVVASITLDELKALDSLIIGPHNGHDVRGVTLTQHSVALGFTYIDKKGGSMADKVNHYRWFIQK